jgi:hypothetical protein
VAARRYARGAVRARRSNSWVAWGAALAATLGASADAHAADAWKLVSSSATPAGYHQGIAASRHALFFDGTRAALFRTTFGLDERARSTARIPKAYTKRYGYNHSGDLGWTQDGGGRLLLPLECYTKGAPNGGNTCGTGAIGVVSPRTLEWLGLVRLSPDEIHKAMWVEPSPNGKLVWTSAGCDLLAYPAGEIVAPSTGGAPVPIHPSVVLAGAAPVAKVSGATFVGRRLFVAGRNGDRLQVWSVDLSSRATALQVDRPIDGESEGLATYAGPGGAKLHWQVQPPTKPGTKGRGRVLHFAPAP